MQNLEWRVVLKWSSRQVGTRYTVASKLSRRLWQADPAERRFDAGTGSRYLINMEKKDEILNQVQDDQI